MAEDNVKGNIESYLKQAELVFSMNPSGSFVVPYESTAVNILVSEIDEKVWVGFYAPIAREIQRLTPEAMEYMLAKNFELRVGKFGYAKDGNTIWYEHSVLGNNMDYDEFFSAMAMVVTTANEHDETIAGMVGGKRYID